MNMLEHKEIRSVPATEQEHGVLAKLDDCLTQYAKLPMENFMENRDFRQSLQHLKDLIKGRALCRKFSKETKNDEGRAANIRQAMEGEASRGAAGIFPAVSLSQK